MDQFQENLESEYASRTCPACNSNPPADAEISSRVRAEHVRYDSLKPYWNGFFKEKAFFSYHRCTECGLLYCPVYFWQAQLEELYRQMPDNTAGVPVAALRKTQRGYFDVLRMHSLLKGEYLEIGPDIGLFTEQCAQEGGFERFHLFEPNREVWPALRRTLAGKVHHIYDEMFGFDKIRDQSISVAVMIHVLDHLIDPVSTLQAIKTKLIENAVVIFVTHDESSILAKTLKEKWPPYCLQHPQLFRPQSITTLLQRSGFGVMQITKTANHFPMTYLAKHFFWSLGLKLDVWQWNQPQVSLRLGNILTVATPK
jgi:hypothetical protein